MPVFAYGNKKPKIHPTAWIHPNSEIIGDVFIGPKVYVGSGSIIRGDLGKIHIDEGSAILENVIIQVSPNQKIYVGKSVTLSVGAILHNCIIRDGAMVGMGAIVSDNADIGEGAIIAEGSVVKNKIEAGTVAAGIPAKKIKAISENQKGFNKIISAVYQNLTQDYREKIHILEPKDYRWDEESS